GIRNFTTSLSRHSSFWCATRLPSISIMPITRLLLCRSIPAITFFIGRLSVDCCSFIYLLPNDNSFTASRPPRPTLTDLNAYHLMVLSYSSPPVPRQFQVFFHRPLKFVCCADALLAA